MGEEFFTFLWTSGRQWCTLFHMKHEALTDQIKTRVQPSVKKAFQSIAVRRHLDVSDIVREALREYLSKDTQSDTAVPQS